MNIIEAYKPVKSDSFTLVAVGDVLCHKALYDACHKDDYSKILSEYNLDKNNLNFYNQESIIGGQGFKSFSKIETLTNQAHFAAENTLADAMLNAGFNMVSLANNHVLDIDEKGVKNSIKYWKTKNVVYAGQYLSEKERFTTNIYEKNNIKYAFFAYTQKFNTKQNNIKHKFYRNDYDKNLVKRDIESVRDKVDVIIVSIHWGSEHTFTPNQEQRETAKYLAELGVDIVLGHHSHCVQSVEMIGKTFVAYSLGNFIACQNTTAISTRIGLELTIKVIKTDNVITLKPCGRLVYLHSSPTNKEFKLKYLDTVKTNVLPNKDVLLKTYWDSVIRHYKIPYFG